MVEPTAPPRCLPPGISGGQVKVPLTVMAPCRPAPPPRPRAKDRASCCRRRRGIVSPAHSISSGAASSLRAAAATSIALSFFGGVDRGVADHECDARGIGAVVLRRHRAVAGDDAHAAQRRCPASRPRRSPTMVDEPWPISAAPVSAGDAAVEIELELHHRVRLAGPVDRLGGAADVMRAGHAEPLPGGSLPLRSRQPLARST